jgi:integrase
LKVIRDDFASRAYRGSAKTLWLTHRIEFACYTGLRRSELERLRWRDVGLDSGHLTVRNDELGTTKSGAERRVPIVGKAEEILLNLQDTDNPSPTDFVFTSGAGRPLDGHYVSKRFRRYRKLAGLPDEICFHSCRHTCASWLVIKGVSLYVVKEVLGHSSIEVTQRYAHLAPDSMREEMLRAFAA